MATLSSSFQAEAVASQGSLERRADARVSVEVPVTAVFRGRAHRYWLQDISRGGARLHRGGDAPPASLFTLEVEFGAHEPLRLLARKVRDEGRSHAVRFLALDDYDRLELAEVIDRLEPAGLGSDHFGTLMRRLFDPD